MQKESCDFGLIGLAVMGQNLVLNMNDHGYRVAVFNRTVSKVDEFIQNEAAGTQVAGAHSIEEFVGSLKRPRRVMLMVKAGDTVDQMIDSLLPHLDKGDIVIDGGNSHYPDTNRRTSDLAEKGILFIGTGVSGGEGRALRPVDNAGGQSCGLAPRQRDLSIHRRQGGRRLAMLRLGRRKRRGPLRQDDPQRHRVRRHAAHM